MKLLSTMTDNPVDETIESVVESTNYLVKWWNTLDWTVIISYFVTRVLYIFVVIIVFTILNKLIKTLLKRAFKRNNKKGLSKNRRNTIYTMVDNVVSYIMFFFVGYSILSILGIPVSTLLAGAGIAGIAIGLGAQSFISDIVNGFFILLENQIDVGDTVIIDEITGSVVSVGLRSTQLKGFDGTHHFIPNHMIETISNKSRNDMRAMIELSFFADSDFEKIDRVIQAVNDKYVSEHPEIIQGPSNLGPTRLGNGLISLNVVFYTLNGQQFNVQNKFLARYLQAFKLAEIELPKDPFFQ